MNFNADVLPCLQNIEICIHKFKQLGLLNRDQRCPNCQEMCFWTKYLKSKDGWAWKCQTKLCQNYKNYISIRKGSFFANSNIPLPKWLHLMYLWATKASNKQTQLQTGLSNHTIIDAFACLREICGRYLQENPIQLGGPGIIVQVDESQFSHKPKHHRGRAAENPFWVFGIVDTSFKPSVGFMEIVENRGAEILLPIIQSVVRPGSIVHSDEWRSYRQIQGRTGLSHRTVNHSINFVEPITGVHTQNIESYWNVKKTLIKKMLGCQRKLLHWYLQEYMWRDRFDRNNNAFDNIVGHINLFYQF